MRGALLPSRFLLTGLGIIPADAGNTYVHVRAVLVGEDHPRGCGEHSSCVKLHSCDMGSSPRMRGTHDIRNATGHRQRIIPADAGNTPPDGGHPQATADHPRGCGEHYRWGYHRLSGWGSSPRMRGTPLIASNVTIGNGIIPADAGNTCTPRAKASTTKDHPRGCGEHFGMM